MNASRQEILISIAHTLFGSHKVPHPLHSLIVALSKDLDTSPCMHSLFKIIDLPQGGVLVPLMVYGSNTDMIISRFNLNHWKTYFKPTDVLWMCPDGYHFFHYFYPVVVAKKIKYFWR